LAALTILAPIQGSLVNVYSVNYDRATELLKASKAYLNWYIDLNLPTRPEIITSNERSVRVKTHDGFEHEIAARGRNPDSCRGDNPAAALFDEIAFVQPSFWYQFAFPLLQVGKRVFTAATTPPHYGSFFQTFIEGVPANNDRGEFFFRIVNHSLVCSACDEADVAEQCVHRLMLVPPWKSVLKFWKMSQLVPDNRKEDFETVWR